MFPRIYANLQFNDNSLNKISHLRHLYQKLSLGRGVKISGRKKRENCVSFALLLLLLLDSVEKKRDGVTKADGISTTPRAL